MSPQKKRNLGKVTSVRLELDVLRRLEALRHPLEADPVTGPAGPWTPSAIARYAFSVGVATIEERLGIARKRRRAVS